MTRVRSVRDIGPAAWQALESPDFPFTDYAFLEALESSGSVGGESGWMPLYEGISDAQGLAALSFSYVKSHSYGEYIFDWEWARFYQRYQKPYYPKLLHAVPFTPATGPRFLLRPGAAAEPLREALIAASLDMAEKNHLSSVHSLFITDEEQSAYEQKGFAIRHSLQYHWRNQGYRDFRDYLDSFVGKRRRDIQRERQRVEASGLTIRHLTGTDLKPEHGDLMEELYLATAEKKEAIPYLREGFFRRVFQTMADRILLVIAEQDGKAVAGALNFFKGSSLFGRYWGSLADFQNLHFELCYYQTIDFAIARGLKLFEAGAQGEHKIQRGFRPSLTLSAHRILDPVFRAPIEKFVLDEQLMIREALRELDGKSPFKR